MAEKSKHDQDDADLQDGGRERDFAATDPDRRRKKGSDRPKSVDGEEKDESSETGC